MRAARIRYINISESREINELNNIIVSLENKVESIEALNHL